MRKLFTLLALFASLCLMAQEDRAMKVLDIAAERIRQAGNVKIEFKATVCEGAKEVGSTSGTMWLQEKKIKLDTGNMLTWYNGKTRWCYVPRSNEVNIDEPSKNEMAAINPYTFMGIYKKGFKMSVKETVLRGDAVYEVYLRARYAKMDVKEVYVDVRKKDYQPICIRVREDKDWQRVAVLSFEGNQQLPANFFDFPSSEYPGVIENDMR